MQKLDVDIDTRRTMIKLELSGVARDQIAKQLGLPLPCVERTLRYARMCSPAGRIWSDERILEVEQAVADGLPLEDIYERFSITKDMFFWLRKRFGILTYHEAGWLTLNETMRLLGVSKATLLRWMDASALPYVVRRSRRSAWSGYLINIASIVRFLRRRAYWDEWHIHKITDPELRRIATMIRAVPR
jgi:predicted DNA-binding transcriptional regulator AlpA